MQCNNALYLLVAVLVALANAMTPKRMGELRQEAVAMFYHGFDNYMKIAFPEDELRPVSCVPLTRDQQNPRNVELNDVLGNYSLTLIDSLSTLAIIASAPADAAGTGAKALRDFQDGISALVVQYGDGTDGPSGQGLRGRGFDVDSKVQVFETVIRGVGGLISAHLFACGELPIKGYKPLQRTRRLWKSPQDEGQAPILWPNGFKYNGQMLNLALDLAQRLLPAFYTNTGMPYPRVNLRHGVPFYQNSPLNQDSEGECAADRGQEITETCSAGAGSLVLEFTTLSRLTGDPRFEQLAKRAFWAVWSRRSPIGLIGAGVDAEVGHWVGPYAGIGAGTDSFFEYALKTHILLSGHDTPNTTAPSKKHNNPLWLDPNTIYSPLSDEENSSESFLQAWQEAHAAIKRHLYSNTHHPHYVNVHLGTGSPQAYWIDSLGAYYPGLLTLAGELEEAIVTNLLYTALWTRYSALPERWSVRDGHVEGGLGWWPGRPEFIESNYHIYRATKDPWYLYVGEMVLKDIKRRCWTPCGWTGLQDVHTGEKSDRMESFFLGETAKYMYLLFDTDHPLNHLDAPFVFTTEGHPLIIPRKVDPRRIRRKRSKRRATPAHSTSARETCPAPPASIPLTVSATASRADIFHAASLIGLHHVANIHALGNGSLKDGHSCSGAVEPNASPNHTYYPWTLPMNLVPANSTCARLPIKATFNIEFPSNTQLPTPPSGFNIVLGPQGLVRINNEGILVKSLQGVKLGMVEEEPSPVDDPEGVPYHRSWRVWNIGSMSLGRDEKVFVKREVIGPMNDPSFTRIRDSVMLDVVLQIENVVQANVTGSDHSEPTTRQEAVHIEESGLQLKERIIEATGIAAEYRTLLSSLLHHVTSVLRDPVATLAPQPQLISSYSFQTLVAVAPVGIGAAPLPDVDEAPDPESSSSDEKLSWTNVYFAGEACHGKLPEAAVRYHQVIVIRRGGCSFSSKLANIPSFTPAARGFQFLIVVSGNEHGDDEGSKLTRPLLDEPQHTPSGLLRHHQISMALVIGGDDVYQLLQRARSVGIRRRYHVESQGIPISNLVVV